MQNDNVNPNIITPAQIHIAQEKKIAGQRLVSFLWESTQGLIAIMITSAVIYCALRGIVSQEMSNAFFLIVSMYFVRTNHQMAPAVVPNQAELNNGNNR